MNSSLTRAWLFAGALLLAATPAANAQAAAPAWRPAPWKPPVGAVRPAAFAPGAAGMIVAVDPETGALGMPTARQAEALTGVEANMLSRSAEGLRVQYLGDGTMFMDLQGRFQEFSVARIGEGGRLTFECLSNLDAVRAALRSPLPRPAVWEDR